MSLNHHTPPPAPGPLCVIYKPQLALLALGKLDEQEAGQVRAHVAGCEYCQLMLREYEIVREAFASHFGGAAAASEPPTRSSAGTRTAAPAIPALLTLEDIMQAANKPSTPTQAGERPAQPRDLSPRRRALTALSAIAAVLVLAVLAASLFSYLGTRGSGPAVKPTPTRGLDAQSQAYVNVLETYYQPLGETFDQEVGCQAQAQGASASAQPSLIQSCQVQEAKIVNDVHAFADHLTLPPPSRWQTADTQFKQANQEMISGFGASVRATTPSEWTATLDADQAAEQLYCAPVAQINTDLVQAGFPLSSLLPVPSSPITTLCPNHA